MTSPAAARKVTVIPATVDRHTHLPTALPAKRRVAGYARVSTDSEEQLTSYEAQVDYYTGYIKSHENWEFVNVYTDEGISALNTTHRTGFNEMISDALAGKIDLIIAKSVSRFARNTVDSLVTIRELKAAGVECYFEKENIYTFDGKGELLLTIMSSLAQEESRSISENVTWGKRKQFADGKISLAYKTFLGYEKGEDGLPKIIPEQAAVVRRIYADFMAGKTPYTIAKALTAEGIPTPSGKTEWLQNTVKSILTNEKYKGSAVLQKKFTTDFLTKKSKLNEGEVPQYYVEHSHEAIIDPGEWDAVQLEIQNRKTLGRSYSSHDVFSTRLVCGDCGAFYGSKLWHSTSRYRRTVLQCNGKFRGEKKCETPHFDRADLEQRFLRIWNSLIENRNTLIEDCRMIMEKLTDVSEIDRLIEETASEIDTVIALAGHCVEDNARNARSQAAFEKQYRSFLARHDAAEKKLDSLKKQKAERESKAEAVSGFLFRMTESETPLSRFDERLFLACVEKIIANRDGRLEFVFRDGTVLEG